MLARRSEVLASYQGVDISEDLQNDMTDFEYVDNASGDSDSVRISLKDENHIWLNHWFPEKGDAITPAIRTLNWRNDGDLQYLPCGQFFIDEPKYSGRPSTFTIDAISSPLNRNFADVPQNQTWRNITIKEIAKEIARKAGLSFQFIGENNPIYQTKEQSDESDASFLSELCEEESLAMKVTDSKLVIFDEREFENREVVASYSEANDSILDYEFTTKLTNTNYDGVRVTYHDPMRAETITYLHAINEVDEKSKIYHLNKKVSSKKEARRLAQRTLRNLNKKETTGTINMIGNIELLGATCIQLNDFGSFSGKYYVQQASHSIRNGFVTSVEVRKITEG